MATDRGQNRSTMYGAIIVVAITIITLLVFFIPDVYRTLTPSTEIVAVMPDAGALEAGSEVWLAGHEIGSVVRVELQPIGTDSARRVAVTMDIPNKFARHIRRDSRIRMTTETMIGKPVLDILLDSARGPAIRNGDTLVVRPSGTLTALLEKTEAMTARSNQFFRDMETVERRTTDRSAQMQQLNRNMQSTMKEFSTLMTTMRSSPMRTFSDPQFKQLLDGVMQTSSQLSAALGNAADRARRAQSEAEPSLRRLAARADTIRTIVTDIQRRIDEGGGGILIRAQKDSAIVKALHAAQVEMDSLMAETKRNPLRFWF